MNSTHHIQSLWHPVQIGSLTIPGNVFLAPLAGYTDRAFRSICIDYGAALTYSEMVSAEGVARKGANSLQLMERSENEHLFAIQLFMPDAEVVRRALPTVLQFNPSIIDINCGCPVPKVVKTGAGSSLLRHPEKIYDIVQTIVDSCTVPVSIKIRTGWDADSINWKDTVDAALRAGVSMITMHARTKAMGYSGTADWQSLADLKRYIVTLGSNIPIFGSGDLYTAQDVRSMLLQTGIDGVMIARGAIGNPFIFTDAAALLTEEDVIRHHSIHERVQTMQKQLLLHSESVGEALACRQMRKHAAAYVKHMANASKIKRELVICKTIADYEKVFSAMLEIENDW